MSSNTSSSYYTNDFVMTGRGESTRLQGAVVNADLFPLLGVAPVLGRGFLPEEDNPGERVGVVKPATISTAIQFRSQRRRPVDGPRRQELQHRRRHARAFQFPIQNDPVELWTTVAIDDEGRAGDDSNEAPTT